MAISIKKISIGGNSRPISFGMEVFYLYELETGNNMDDLVQRVLRSGIESIQQPEKKTGSLVDIIDLVYWGLRAGAELSGEDFELSKIQIASWFNSEMDKLVEIMTILGESLPRGEQEQNLQKKTKIPRRKTV